jgi:hypothetical protein
VIVGAVVSIGAPDGDGSTGRVALELADELPAELVAVTVTISVPPPVGGVQMRSFAPAICVHELPAASHDDHWYEKLIGFEPCQLPASAWRTRPWIGVPTIVGGVALAGLAAELERDVRAAAVASGTKTKKRRSPRPPASGKPPRPARRLGIRGALMMQPSQGSGRLLLS